MSEQAPEMLPCPLCADKVQVERKVKLDYFREARPHYVYYIESSCDLYLEEWSDRWSNSDSELGPETVEDRNAKAKLIVKWNVRADVTRVPTDNYVAWCRYVDDGNRIVLCDSDAKGAFKVYRAQPSTGDLISREAVVAECNRFLEKLSGRNDDRRDGAFVAISRLTRNLIALPAVQPPTTPNAEAVRAGADGWRRIHSTDCVECPNCLFTFAAVHTEPDGSYSCPNCESEPCSPCGDKG
jgi:hypothetical protein